MVDSRNVRESLPRITVFIAPLLAAIALIYLLHILRCPWMSDDFQNHRPGILTMDLSQSRDARFPVYRMILQSIPGPERQSALVPHLITGMLQLVDATLLCALFLLQESAPFSRWCVVPLWVNLVLNPLAFQCAAYVGASYPLWILLFSCICALSVVAHFRTGKKKFLLAAGVFGGLSSLTGELGVIMLLLPSLLALVEAPAAQESRSRAAAMVLGVVAPAFVCYRLLIGLLLGQWRAIQEYRMSPSPVLVLSQYGRMFWIMRDSMPVLPLAISAAGLALLAFLPQRWTGGLLAASIPLRPEPGPRSLWMGGIGAIVLALMLPFSLLGGRLKWHWFGLCSSVLILLAWTAFAHLLSLAASRTRNPAVLRGALGAVACMLVWGFSAWGLTVYRQDLSRTGDLRDYVAGFLAEAGRVSRSLPDQASFLVQLDPAHTRRCPKHLFDGSCEAPLGLLWHLQGLARMGLIDQNHWTAFVRSAGAPDQPKRPPTGERVAWLREDEWRLIAGDSRPVGQQGCLYRFDGTSLIPRSGISAIAFKQRGNPEAALEVPVRDPWTCPR